MTTSTCVPFVTVCDDGTQNWFHTASTLQGVLEILSQKMPHLASVYLQSDNASNYSGTAAACCLPIISAASPIKIVVSTSSGWTLVMAQDCMLIWWSACTV